MTYYLAKQFIIHSQKTPVRINERAFFRLSTCDAEAKSYRSISSNIVVILFILFKKNFEFRLTIL